MTNDETRMTKDECPMTKEIRNPNGRLWRPISSFSHSSFVNALLLRPPSVAAPGDLWQVWRQNLKGGSAFERYQGLSYPGYVYFRDHNESFATLAAFDPETPFMSWARNGVGQSVQCQFVSGNFFDVCGIGTALGRSFGPLE
jgi:hypothetical protein